MVDRPNKMFQQLEEIHSYISKGMAGFNQCMLLRNLNVDILDQNFSALRLRTTRIPRPMVWSLGSVLTLVTRSRIIDP